MSNRDVEATPEEVKLFELLGPEHRALVEKHYRFYRSLEIGAREPRNRDQERFVDVCKGRVLPKTDHERAYAEHLCNRRAFRVSLENKSLVLNKQTSLPSKGRERPKPSLKSNTRSVSTPRPQSSEVKKKVSQKSNPTPPATKVPTADQARKAREQREQREKIQREMAMERARQREKQSENEIPDYEEGYARPGWISDDDYKKMRRQDFADMKKNHRD